MRHCTDKRPFITTILLLILGRSITIRSFHSFIVVYILQVEWEEIISATKLYKNVQRRLYQTKEGILCGEGLSPVNKNQKRLEIDSFKS